MASDADWTDGPAKWVAVGLLSAAAIAGMTWTIARKYPSRPETVIVHPPPPAGAPASGTQVATAPDDHPAAARGPQPPPTSVLEVIAREPNIIAVEAPTTTPPAGAAGPAEAEESPAAAPSAQKPEPKPSSPHADVDDEPRAPDSVEPETSPLPEEPPPPSPRPPAAPSYAHIININTASAAELELLPGIGPALAGRIVDYRTTSGPFRTVDDITKVRGIGPKTLEKLRARIRVK